MTKVIEGIISCDSHLVEPVEGLPEGARWDGEGGVLLSLGEGYECPSLPVWPAVSNGKPLAPVGSLAEQPAAWDPVARRKWQGENGVAAEVLYPTFALTAVETAQTEEAAHHAAWRYNIWAALHFKAPHFWPVALAPAYDPIDLSAQLRGGFADGIGLLLPSQPAKGRWRDFEAVFAAAEELGVTIHWHAFSRPTPGSFGRHPLQVAWEAFRPAQDILVELLCEGVLARHPGLKVVFAESDTQWLHHAMERLAYYGERYGKLVRFEGWDQMDDIVAHQVSFVVPARELSEMKTCPVLWGCDFPHADADKVERDAWMVAWFNDQAVALYPRIGEALAQGKRE